MRAISTRVTAMIAVAAVAICGGLASASLAAGRGGHGGGSSATAAIRVTSLQQSGRTLLWRVTLARRLSDRDLSSGRRTVCLLLSRRRSGAGAGALCLAAPHGHDPAPTVTWTPGSGAARARPTAATVSRIASASLQVNVIASRLGLGWRDLHWQTRSTARAAGCSASDGGTATCTAVLPRRPRFIALHTPILSGCVAAGPSIRYSGPPRREIALTFDDGPWPDPPSIDFVRELARLRVPGTFFEIGDQIHEYDPTGSVERAMLAAGDMIGNHTWTHPDMLGLSTAAQTSELAETNAAIRRATGFTPCLWRPPYGAIDPALEGLARRMGLLSVYWDIDPRDWSLPGESSIIRTVLAEARDGGIVEMHFGGGPRDETLDALPAIVADLRARGYRFVNLATMFGLRETWR